MALGRMVAAASRLAAAASLLAGCDGAPARLEGTALLGKPFPVRSALVGVRYSGSGGAPGGRLVLTDRPDYCETLRLRREAEARGESLLLDTEHSTLVLFLSGTRLEPGALRAGTYAVNAGSGGGYTMLPLQVEGGLFRVTADELRASIAVAGKVAFDQRVSFREGAEVSGRLSLMFDRDQQETLEGEFTATYCESL